MLTVKKPRISIGFKFFARTFNPRENFFFRQLSKLYEVDIEESPQYMIFSVHDGGPRWRMPHIEGPFTRIFFTMENCRPDMERCEWAFTFDYDDIVKHPRHMRLPYYYVKGAGDNLIKDDDWALRVLSRKQRKFCNYFYSKDATERVAFTRMLSQYKKIDAPGASLNNMSPVDGPWFVKALSVAEFTCTGKRRLSALIARHFYQRGDALKIDFLRKYKFTIAFENSSYPGYTTEKIYHPMLAGSIPIYWGNPQIGREFNTKSIINIHDYSSLDEAITEIKRIDTDQELYKQYLTASWYKNNLPNEYVDEQRFLNRCREIFGK